MSCSHTAQRRRRVARLPIAATGHSTGHCFLAAMLAHTDRTDLEKEQVSSGRIRDLRKLPCVPARGYIAGDAQQAIAEHLEVGYILVQPESRKATLYTVGKKDPSDLSYAMLVHPSRRHVEPLATRGGMKCGSVTHDRAMELLMEWGVTLAPRKAAVEIVEE